MGLHSLAIVLVLGYSMLHRIRERNIPGGAVFLSCYCSKWSGDAAVGANPYSASQNISLYTRLPSPWRRRLGEHSTSHALLTSPTPRAAVPQQGAPCPRPAPTMAAASATVRPHGAPSKVWGSLRAAAGGSGRLVWVIFCLGFFVSSTSSVSLSQT